MGKYKIETTTRFFLFIVSLLLWAGIYLTGFKTIHWIIYIPAIVFPFAVVTRICPLMILSKILFNKK